MTARFFAQWESGLLSDDMRSSLLQMEYLTEAESDVRKDPAQGSCQQRKPTKENAEQGMPGRDAPKTSCP